jgi:cellulose synthase/poly-beta-1,6-N-acetylglucosamine synthase-like glycosyltransferase
VSILVPAWCEEKNLPSCMASLLNLRYPNKEIVVCAGGGDGSYKIAKSFSSPNVVVLAQIPDEGKQRALQRCFELSKGKVIFLTDADCIMEDQVFERTLYPILMQGKDVTTGTWRPWDRILRNPLVQYQWSHHLYREAWLPDYPSTLDGRNSAIQRAAIEKAEPFRADAPTGTDYVQSKKLTFNGYKICLVRSSRVLTEYPETVQDYWRQLSRWTRTSLLLGKHWGDIKISKSTLRSCVYSLILIFSIPFLFERVLLVIWLTTVFHLALAQVRFSDLARRYQDDLNHARINFCFLQRYLPIGWIGLIRGLYDSLYLREKRRW